MFFDTRQYLYNNYHKARDFFTDRPESLIEIEYFISQIVISTIEINFDEIERDYNEASYLNPFWANYPPLERGRAPVGDQVPWIEVGEHSVGQKLFRLIVTNFRVSEIGLPSGADFRFILFSEKIREITEGITNCAFVFLDIKSVGPRDNFNHTVISPYQVSGDGIWNHPDGNMINSRMVAQGTRVAHPFFPAISPIYSLSSGIVAPSIHLFVKPVYQMLSFISEKKKGQPLDSIKSICIPNGLLLTINPNYLQKYPRLFFPGKDDKGKDLRKIRARVSFSILNDIGEWRVKEFKKNH